MSTLEPTATTPSVTAPSELQPAPTDAMGREIAAANGRFMTAFRDGDADALAACYTKDGTLLPPNSEPVRGGPAIAAFWNSAIQMGIADARLETVSIEARDDLAVEEGRYTLRGADGGTLDQGTYLVAWRREVDGWKLRHDIWNSSRPAPAP